MSLKSTLLAVLADGPVHGYQLKKAVEALTADLWSINDGQIYTTIQRLERDGLVRTSDEEGQRVVELSEAGRRHLDAWFDETRAPAVGERDELTIKIALALDRPGLLSENRLAALVDRQRRAGIEALQGLTRTKAGTAPADLAQNAVLDAAIARVRAEVEWLDDVDQRRSERRWTR